MYVYNTENIKEDTVKKILNNNLAVDIRLDSMFLLSKEKEIVIGEQILNSNCTLEEYIKDIYDEGEYVDFGCIQIGKNEAVDILINGLYSKCKNGDVSYLERIYGAENPHKEILIIIDECVLVELENRIKILRKIKKQVQNEGVKWQ